MSTSAIALSDVIIVGNTSDDPFAIDVAFAFAQNEDIADLISIKTFANSEFCPRFISDEADFSNIGYKLAGKIIVVVSTSNRFLSRQNLAMRNMLIARAAKENGAAQVVLIEPDLFYSAQDRGPKRELGESLLDRDEPDLKKFDGQPFTAKLYAQMLRLAGVDRVVHCSSHGVYGRATRWPIREDAPLRADTLYRRSKLAAERVVWPYLNSARPTVAIARPSTIYGPGALNWLPLFHDIQIGRSRVLGDLRHPFHVTYVDDVVAGLRCCGGAAAAGGIFNLAASARGIHSYLTEAVVLVGATAAVGADGVPR